MMIRRLLAGAGLLLAWLGVGLGGSATWPGSATAALQRPLTLTYCHAETLDLYMPSHAVARPVLLALDVHGGGTTSGSKTDLNPVFEHATARQRALRRIEARRRFRVEVGAAGTRPGSWL